MFEHTYRKHTHTHTWGEHNMRVAERKHDGTMDLWRPMGAHPPLPSPFVFYSHTNK